MKYPKKFNTWTLDEQEAWLSSQYAMALKTCDDIFRQLAVVRGGMKVKAVVEDVPGLDYAGAATTQRSE